MTNTQSHAKRELDILSKTVPDAIITPFANEIIALAEAFGKSGQSGGSAPYTASAISQAINKLLLFEPISPLTGNDDEWTDIAHHNNNEPLFQNNRDSRVFKDGNTGKAYFIDAIVFEGDLGGSFTGRVNKSSDDGEINSLQYIKSFPFKPKTFYIKVVDFRWKDKEETQPDPNGDWWSHTIENEEQLKEVFEYYNME